MKFCPPTADVRSIFESELADCGGRVTDFDDGSQDGLARSGQSS
jgi:hypothetical protein